MDDRPEAPSHTDDHLTALHDAVRLTRTALDGAGTTAPSVSFSPPPTPDAPLHPRDQRRAAALLAELDELVLRLAAEQRRVGTELASLRRPRPDRAGAPEARYVDGYG